MSGLTGSTIVLTGAAGGIGQAVARVLGREGANLALLGRTMDSLDAVREAISSSVSGTIRGYAGDLGSPHEAARLAREVSRDFSRLDVLVHGAGVYRRGSVQSAPEREFDEQYRVNVRAPYLLTRALLPGLRTVRGQVIFLNSTVGLRGKGGLGGYSASKHALVALADSLRDEVNAAGVKVTTLFLGRTATPMQGMIHEMEDRAYHPERLIQPEDVAELLRDILVLPPSVEVTDVRLRPMMKPL